MCSLSLDYYHTEAVLSNECIIAYMEIKQNFISISMLLDSNKYLTTHERTHGTHLIYKSRKRDCTFEICYMFQRWRILNYVYSLKSRCMVEFILI